MGWLPFEDDMFSYVLALDFMEHIPHRSPNQEVDGELFISLVSDLIRVSKNGARWLIICPARALSMQGAGHCRLVQEGTWELWRWGDKSSGEVPVAQKNGELVLVRTVNIRQWTPDKFFGRAAEKAMFLRVVKP